MPPASLHLGLNLGATNLKALVERTDGWRTLATRQTPTRADTGPDGIVAELDGVGLGAVRAVGAGVTSVGIGIPSLYVPTTGATRFLPNVPGDWAGRAVAGRSERRSGRRAALVNGAPSPWPS